MELAEHVHQLLGLDCVGEGRPAAEVGEEHRDLSPVADQDRVVPRGDDCVRKLGREEPLEPAQPLEFVDLGPDALLQRPVELLDLVVVALHAQK